MKRPEDFINITKLSRDDKLLLQLMCYHMILDLQKEFKDDVGRIVKKWSESGEEIIEAESKVVFVDEIQNFYDYPTRVIELICKRPYVEASINGEPLIKNNEKNKYLSSFCEERGFILFLDISYGDYNIIIVPLKQTFVRYKRKMKIEKLENS